MTAVVNKSRCPLLLTRDLSGLPFRLTRPSGRLLPGFGLAFAFRERTEAVVGAVGKWESRAVCEISKRVWETEETCFWFSPASMPASFPRRFEGVFSVGVPSAENWPT